MLEKCSLARSKSPASDPFVKTANLQKLKEKNDASRLVVDQKKMMPTSPGIPPSSKGEPKAKDQTHPTAAMKTP